MNLIKNNRIPIRDLTYISLFTTLIILCSWIKIPFIIPYTMQSFGIFLAVGLLGGKRSTISILLYILLGAIGLPVFSGFAGGLGILFGNTGGYIIGFLAPPLFKWITERIGITKDTALIFSLLFGLWICYCFGTLWYLFIYTESINAQNLFSVLSICVVPFVIPDLIKLIFAVILTKKMKKHIK